MNAMTFEEIISFEKLYESYMKCKRGVMWKDSVSHFDLNAVSEINKLHNELKRGTYKPRNTSRFTITSPKKREIVSISFRDRVYQRSLNDNALYPIMTKSFIYDNCACQKGKGTDFARKRLKHHIRKYYIEHHSDGYALKIDIKKYYQSMSHKLVEEMFVRKIEDTDITNATLDVLRSQYEGSRGYNPGSQMVQIAGVSFLDGLDHYIKECLCIKHYVRYMDDLIIIHENAEHLDMCLGKIEAYLHTLELQINDGKTKIIKLSDGFEFMGFRYRLSNTGKVVMTIKSECVKRERKHLKGLIRRYQNGYMTKPDIDKCFQSWIEHASKGDTHNAVVKMRRYYEKLWSEVYGNN